MEDAGSRPVITKSPGRFRTAGNVAVTSCKIKEMIWVLHAVRALNVGRQPI